MTKPLDIIALARTNACRKLPYASHVILSMQVREVRGSGTLSVDEHWRMTYDPEFCERLTPDDRVFVICHEALHCWLNHCKRAKQQLPAAYNALQGRVPMAQLAVLLNCCQDAVINPMLVQSGLPRPENSEGVWPQDLGLKEGMSVDQMFWAKVDELKAQLDQQQNQSAGEGGDDEAVDEHGGFDAEGNGQDGDQQQDGDGQEGQAQGAGDLTQDQEPDRSGDDSAADEPGADSGAAGESGQPEEADSEAEEGSGASLGGQCESSQLASEEGSASQDTEASYSGPPGGPGESGSCSDGIPRPWEEVAPPSDEAGGLQDYQQEIERQKMSERIKECSEKGRGNVPGGLLAEAVEMLRPRLDPRRLLQQAIADSLHRSTELKRGDRRTYRRPSRRPGIGGLMRPRAASVTLGITVIVDTSASMSEREIRLGVGLISRVLEAERHRDGIKVITGDTSAVFCKQIWDASKVLVGGGGGTNMRKLIIEAAEDKPQPDLILVCTDGETYWPQENVGVATIVCLTEPESSVPSFKVPGWMKKVELA